MATVQHDQRLGVIPAQRAHADGSLGVAESLAAAPAPEGLRSETVTSTSTVPATVPGTAPVVPDSLPTQRSAPAAETVTSVAPDATTIGRPAPQAAETRPRTPARRGSRRTRTALIASLVVVLLAALTTGIVLKVQADARAAERVRAQARVTAEVEALRVDEAFLHDRSVAVTQASAAARSAATRASALAAVTNAQAALAATPNAGDGPRAALQASIDAVNALSTSTGAGTNLRSLRTTVAAVAAPQQAATDAQVAWQVAEDARIAAEKAAAEAAAAEQAAAAKAAASKRTTGTSRTTTTRKAAASSGGSAAAAAAPAAAATAGDGYSAGSIGAALNAYRASQGLGALSIVGSGSRVDHAGQMAASNSIWHSSNRSMAEIVGRVSPASASAMINAYANSSGHQAIMVGDYSTAYIGAVTYDGWLYTSIQFG